MSISIPDTSDVEGAPANEQTPVGGRPNWWVSFVVVLACLAVVASGWGVTKLAVGTSVRPEEIAALPAALSVSEPSVAGMDPEDATAYLGVSADLVDDASTFHVTFTVREIDASAESATASGGEAGGESVVIAGASSDNGDLSEASLGEGEVIYDFAGNPKFKHVFISRSGREVLRYHMRSGQLVMTADSGVPGLVVLDPPDEADRTLCSRAFATANLREVLATSPDLAFAGREEVELEQGGESVTHSTYRYTGTFTALRGGYDSSVGANTLTSVEDTAFELWIDEDGYPRRFVLESRDGIREVHEYHSFT